MNTVIHAAFRRDVARFDTALATFPPGSRDRAAAIGRAWDNYDYQLHHHHNDEETIFWPMVLKLGVDPALLDDLEGEHAAMIAALEGTESAMTTFRADPTAANTATARAAVNELSTVLLNHLEHEERDLEPFSADHSETPENAAAQKEVRKSHKGNMGTFIAWLLDGATENDKAGLKQEIPPPVVFVVSTVGGRKYRREVASVWA